MLHAFQNKLTKKRGAAGAKAPIEESARTGPSKGSKKHGREGSNIARTVKAAGQLPTPPPSRSVRAASPPNDDFNRSIPTAVTMPVSASGGSSLALLGGDRSFSQVVSFNLPPSLEGLIGSVRRRLSRQRRRDDLSGAGVGTLRCRRSEGPRGGRVAPRT